MNRLPDNPKVQSPADPVAKKQVPKPKAAAKPKAVKDTFVVWYGKNKKDLAEEFPELDDKKITMKAIERYKEMEKAAAAIASETEIEEIRESKKRKISDVENDKNRISDSTANKLSSFAFTG